jgi:hypothetical protein
MRETNSIVVYCVLFVCLAVGGCQQGNTVLTATNYVQKFDDVESSNIANPGTLTLSEVETMLGTGYPIQAGDPAVADFPPGSLAPELEWRQWAFNNETLLVGFAKDRASAVTRVRR